MSENPRQFTSLDYADADMYGALTSRPSTATPLNLPLEDLSGKKPSGGISPGEAAHYRDEETRRRFLFLKQQEAQALREAALREREIARNLALQTTKPTQLEEPTVSSRDYEKGFAPPKSTPERQPLPSTGSPQPTLNGTAARANPLVEPTATPAPAALKEAIATTAAQAISALPKALPQAAGRLVIPGVGAALSVGTRLVVGQSVTQAVTSTGAGLVGTGIGAIVGTAIGGPIGGVVGSMIGGTAASLFSDWLFAQNLPSTGSPPQTVPQYLIMGGQSPGVQYRITGRNLRVPDEETTTNNFLLWGPISGPNLSTYQSGNTTHYKYEYNGYNASGVAVSIVVADNTNKYNVITDSITRIDGTPDTGLLTTPAPPPDNLPYRYNASPIGDDNTVASGTPAAGSNKGKTRNVAPSMPSNNTPNGAPFFPGHGGLAPSYLPNPEHQPSNLGGMLPAIKNAPQPLLFAEPEDLPLPRLTAKTTDGVISTTATNPSTFAYPAYVPEIAQPVPISDAHSPVPKAKSQPSSRTPTQAANDDIKKALEEQKKDFDEQIKRLTAIATGLAALTPAIQGIPDAIAKSPTVQASNKETTQSAVCEIAQPGKCLGKAIDDSANKINQNNNQNTTNLLNKINAGANAAQMALLELINKKLGDFIPGGISGKLQRLSSWLHLDRALNILIWWQTLHNAYMLSANLGQILTSAISNVLAAIGIKDAEGNPLEIGEILGKQFDALAKTVIGESEWGGIKAEYKKWNRIYQAAANLMNSIQSIGYSILSASETISHSHAETLARQIKSIFPTPPFTWNKGHLKCTYSDKAHGYELKLLVTSKAEGERMIRAVLDIRNHPFDRDYLQFIDNDRSYPTHPGTHRVYGRTVQKFTRRRMTDVKFSFAQLLVWGKQNPINLVATSGSRLRNVIKRV